LAGDSRSRANGAVSRAMPIDALGVVTTAVAGAK